MADSRAPHEPLTGSDKGVESFNTTFASQARAFGGSSEPRDTKRILLMLFLSESGGYSLIATKEKLEALLNHPIIADCLTLDMTAAGYRDQLKGLNDLNNAYSSLKIGIETLPKIDSPRAELTKSLDGLNDTRLQAIHRRQGDLLERYNNNLPMLHDAYKIVVDAIKTEQLNSHDPNPITSIAMPDALKAQQILFADFGTEVKAFVKEHAEAVTKLQELERKVNHATRSQQEGLMQNLDGPLRHD